MTIVIDENTITSADLGAIGLVSEDTSDVRASVVSNTMRGNNIVLGDAFELTCADSSTLCLDLEDNIADLDTNTGNVDDGVFRVGEFNTADLEIEQFGDLFGAPPTGAGNSGVLDDSSTGTITPVNDGDCGF